jgi:hypothetical protein
MYQTDLRTSEQHIIPEKSTAVLTFIVEDEEGNPIAGSSLTTLTVTLYNDRDGSAINGRTDTNIKDENGGSVDEDGNGKWKMEELDNPIIQDGLAREDHTALFKWTYNAGADTGYHQVRLRVVNLVKVS